MLETARPGVREVKNTVRLAPGLWNRARIAPWAECRPTSHGRVMSRAGEGWLGSYPPIHRNHTNTLHVTYRPNLDGLNNRCSWYMRICYFPGSSAPQARDWKLELKMENAQIYQLALGGSWALVQTQYKKIPTMVDYEQMLRTIFSSDVFWDMSA